MSKVILQGYIIVADNDLEAVVAALDEHSRLTKQEPGCLTFQLSQNAKNINRFDVYEEFVDQAAFQHHQNRIKDSKWAQITSRVERYYQITGND